MQNQVALGAKRSPTPVKGGIACAPGSHKRGDGCGALRTYGEWSDSSWWAQQDL